MVDFKNRKSGFTNPENNTQGLEKATEGLSPDQTKAFMDLIEFMNSDDSFFSLKGYAGTGKTFMLSRFIPYHLKNAKGRQKIAISAPTHKALAVVSDHFKKLKLGYKVSFSTIHKLLGVKPKINEHTGQEVFESDGTSTMDVYTLLIIDETSMLDDKLFFLVKDAVEERSKKDTLKVLFVGDPKQIPPVNKVDCEPYLHPEEHGIKEIHLTQIMRQAEGNMIIEASMHVRECVDNEQKLELSHYVKPGQFSIYNTGLTVKRNELISSFQTDFTSPEFKANPYSIKVIAYRNVTVASYNKMIRKMYHGVEDLPNFILGDVLVANKPFFVGESVLFNNSEELLVTNIKTGFEIIEDLGGREVETKCYHLTAQIYDAETDKKIEVEFPVVHENSEFFVKSLNSEIAKSAKNAIGRQRGELWERFHSNMKVFADVAYGFACTAHKSQGSTYDKIYVDLSDISLNNNIVERNRIIYTAITRAKQEVIIITK